MKIVKYIVSFLTIAFFLTGCNKFSTPEQLIQKPKNDMDKEIIKKAIEEALPAMANLTIPLNSKESGAINQVDIDGDKKNEVIAFYEEQERNFEIGFIVLKENKGKWEKLDIVKGEGYDIEYASFYDLDNDGKNEIIVSWDYGQYNKTRCIYTIENNKIKEVFNNKYEGMEINDVNEDKNMDIILLDYDKASYKITMHLCEYSNNNLNFIDKIDMITNDMSYFNIKIGKAIKNKKGIFIDMPLGDHGAYTQLVIIENNKLKKVFDDTINEKIKTYQIYPVGSSDINEDGIIEIGLLSRPIGYEKEDLENVPWLNTWYKWNGQDGLNFILENYYDYGEGYIFDIPKEWKGKFTLEQNENSKSKDLIVYYSKNYPYKKEDLLKISSFNKNIWIKMQEELKSKNKDFIILKQNENKVFVAFLNDKNLNKHKDMIINNEEIKNNFKLIY